LLALIGMEMVVLFCGEALKILGFGTGAPGGGGSAGRDGSTNCCFGRNRLPVTRMTTEGGISSEPQKKPSISMSQLSHAHRVRLKNARAAIFKQQHELQAKLHAIDCELRAIAAYEAAKQGLSIKDTRRTTVKTFGRR
jgi:hypothetical protein